MQRKFLGLVFTFAMLTQMSAATAQDRTWNGTGNWDNPDRWGGDVPDTQDENAFFTFTNSGTATVNDNFTIGNLSLSSSNTLTLGTGNTLTVNNFANPFNGTINGAGNLVVGGGGEHAWNTLRMQGVGSTTFSAGNLTIGTLASGTQVDQRTINTNANTVWEDNQNSLNLNNATWNNRGDFTRNQGAGLAANGQLILNNGSTFNNLSTGTFTQAGSIASTVSGGTFNNRGIVVSASTSGLTFSGAVNNIRDVDNPDGGIMRTNGGSMTLSGPITNSGSIIAQDGNITISGTFTNNGGVLDARGGTVTVTSAMTHNGGRLLVDGGTIAGSAPLTFNTSGGIEGVGTITQDVTMNAGTYIAPGNSAGNLSFLGTLAMTDGALRIEVGGATPGDWDTITVAGNATMNGITVEASRINGFIPTFIGQEFLFFTALNDLVVEQWALAPSNAFDLSIVGNTAILVSTVPEPSSLALLGLCTGLGMFARKRRALGSI